MFSFSFSTISTVDLSERDNNEALVIKKEETYDAEVFEEVEAEVVILHCFFLFPISSCFPSKIPKKLASSEENYWNCCSAREGHTAKSSIFGIRPLILMPVHTELQAPYFIAFFFIILFRRKLNFYFLNLDATYNALGLL